MSVIIDEKKNIFRPGYGTPTYVFLGTLQEYEKAKQEKKLFLANSKDSKQANVFFIDNKVIVK